MTSLRDRTVAEIERREQTARKATSGQWCSDSVGDIYALRKPPVAAHVGEIDRAADAEHIALHDPADALRRYTADRERLEEHHPCNDDDTDDPCGAHSSRYECCPCHTPGPCVEQYRIAEALGITPDTGSTP